MSNHNTATLRKLGESAKDVGGKVGNAILDFDWSPVIYYGFKSVLIIFVVFVFPWAIFKLIIKDINNWKTYHIGQKIMYPIVSLLMILTLCLFAWALMA